MWNVNDSLQQRRKTKVVVFAIKCHIIEVFISRSLKALHYRSDSHDT